MDSKAVQSRLMLSVVGFRNLSIERRLRCENAVRWELYVSCV